LAVANQNLASASETSAAAERRRLSELEASNIRAQAAQAQFDADIRLWKTEAERLQDALAESNATVEFFIEHSSNLQRRLDLSQVECFDLQTTFARISR
jgi:predicted  nucleic acid-binding Zn-ribbon protein